MLPSVSISFLQDNLIVLCTDLHFVLHYFLLPLQYHRDILLPDKRRHRYSHYAPVKRKWWTIPAVSQASHRQEHPPTWPMRFFPEKTGISYAGSRGWAGNTSPTSTPETSHTKGNRTPLPKGWPQTLARLPLQY